MELVLKLFSSNRGYLISRFFFFFCIVIQRINTINAQYEEQLVALRARHASRRDEFLRRESQARHQQYQQVVIEQYPTSGVGPSNHHRGSDTYDTYRERGRFPGNTRDHGYEPKVPYPRGRSYDTSSRYYY